MRIGIDATCWANDRGYGRFTREIVRAMVGLAPDSEFVCVLDALAAKRFDLSTPNVRPLVVRQSAPPTRSAGAWTYRSPVDLLRLRQAVAASRPDAFFFPTVYTYFPLPLGLPAVVTVHDAIPERFPTLTLPNARARLFWRLKLKLALAQSRLVLTVSDFAAREVADAHHLPMTRLRIAGEAASAIYRPSESRTQIEAVARRIGLPADARWLTYVGGFNPHKNLLTLIDAHRAAVERLGTPLHIVFAGSLEGDVFYRELPAIREAIHKSGTESLIHWPGFLSDDDLRHLHSGAIALVLPSASEGFGLPAVEAAACGAPVIATTASPLPSLLEGGGVFVRPGIVGDLAEAIARLATDEELRSRLGRRALERATALSWTQGGHAALTAVQEAAR